MMQYEQRWYEAQRKRPREPRVKNYTKQGQGQSDGRGDCHRRPGFGCQQLLAWVVDCL